MNIMHGNLISCSFPSNKYFPNPSLDLCSLTLHLRLATSWYENKMALPTSSLPDR